MQALLDHIAHKPREMLDALLTLFFTVGSQLSVFSLASALLISVVAVSARRRPSARGRKVKLKVWMRAMFPRRIVHSPSTKADVGFFLLNIFAVGSLIGWAMLSGDAIGEWTGALLTQVFGARTPTALPAPLVGVIATIVLFLAYEIGYWLDHYLAHKVPFLWAFHKAHHTAEVLNPLTNFRVHPVDTLVFSNILAITGGLAGGALAWTFGGSAQAYLVNGMNLILVVFIFTIAHLQHSHIWIASTGIWGRILVSPAHHQIHHSADPIHFDKNFGSVLAVWDWMFGTLHTPKAAREPIVFGLGAPTERPHSVTGCLITPFVEAGASLKPGPVLEPSGA